MKRVTYLLMCVLLIGMTPSAWAQTKQKISFKVPAENAKYTRALNMNVGDVPGHLIRISELHRTYPTNPPVFDGVKVVESWTYLSGDLIDGSGSASGYVIFVLENGDKIFGRVQGATQLVANPDGTTKGNASAVTALTGGTGRFRGIRGVLRSAAGVNIIGGVNELQTDGEYWIEK